MRLLVFTLAGERFGVAAADVGEVVRAPAVKTLPGLPAHVRGVLAHRGAWLPAVDPAPLLGLAAGAVRARALIARRGRTRYALLVDDVAGVRAVEERASAGVLFDGEGVITLLDPAALFRAGMPELPEDETMAAAKSAEPAALVVFRVGGNELGLDVGAVLEVLPWEAPSPVPRAPAFLEGMIQLRGSVVPVVDLRKRFEVPAVASDDTRIVVVALAEDRIGLVVDAVLEVLRLPAVAIEPAPAYFRGLAAEYMEAIARKDERLILVLRIDRILTSQERIALEQVELGAGTAGGE